MKQFITIISLLLLLLAFHNAVIIGTENGLLLWYQTLIPSLLPFILVTNALSETNAYQAVALHFQRNNSGRIYELMAIILGNLCGYPIGGKIINDFVKNKCMTTQQAEQILPLASQASPMFLIGYVYTHILQGQIPYSIFIISIYLPIILYYLLLCIFTADSTQKMSFAPIRPLYLKDSFIHSTEIMVTIGIYVIIFSILLEILLPYCKNSICRIILSFFEITTGLKLLNTLPLTDTLQYAVIGCLSAHGGLCSAYQIKGVLEYPNSSIKKYLLNKCILSTGTFCILYLYRTFFY